MAPTLVAQSSAFSSSSSPVGLNLPVSSTAGDLLVALVINKRSSQNGPPTIDNGWSTAIAEWDATRLAYRCVFYKENCGAGEADPSMTSEAGQATYFQTLEFSGVATTGALSAAGTNGSAASPLTATASAADAAIGNLVVGRSLTILSKSGTATTTHTYNTAGTTAILDNDASSVIVHHRSSYGVTTDNSVSDDLQATNSSMNINEHFVVMASFNPPPASLVLEQGFVNFNDPGVYMQADKPRDIRRAWHRRRSGIFVQEYAI